jgi:radical SAM superfamily enzyme YgiQ (UPF0313 family)
MNIVIVTLPIRSEHSTVPPFGALAIIQSLRSAGYKPYFYDIDALRPSEQELTEFMMSFKPDIVGISAVVSTAYGLVKQLCSLLRTKLPETRIILGGNMSASSEILLRFCKLDVCVLGEGEYTIRELALHYKTKINDNAQENLRKIKGIMYLDENGNIVNTGYRPQLTTDEMIDPDFTILEEYSDIKLFCNEPRGYFSEDPRFYDSFRKGKKQGMIMYSKGCVARCSFCYRFDKGYRILPVNRTIDRIEYLIKNYNVGFVVFGDECFGADKKHTAELVKALKELNVLWLVGGVRCNSVSKEILAQWKDAGCVKVIFGMESGSERMLNVMQKRTTAKQNYDVAKWTNETGLQTTYQFVIGLPGETPETINESADFASYALTLDKNVSLLNISINWAFALPGTPLYEYGRSMGILGATIESEEQYLIENSNKEPGDCREVTNFTDCPYPIVLSWHRVIRAIVYYRYLKKFGIEQYYKNVYQKAVKPSILSILRSKDYNLLFYNFPRISYKFRNLLWILNIRTAARQRGPVRMIMLFFSSLIFMVAYLLGKKLDFKYKPLRKTINEDLKNPYFGTKEMRPLRKGR